MDCARCGKSFAHASLRPIGKLLVAFSSPLMISRVGSAVRESAVGRYCPPCRRQMRLCFFVVAFVGGLMMLGVLLQLVGVLHGREPAGR